MNRYSLACDLGAESGRLMLGTLTDEALTLEEVHRFANVPVRANGSLHWNIAELFRELQAGLEKVSARGCRITSLSTDSWGVDYLLFDERGDLIAPTFHYRDARTAKGVEAAFAKVDWKNIFAETGIQFMPLNTIFQLAAEDPERLRNANLLLGIGDGFNHWLGGEAVAEQSLASTTQLYNPQTGTWSDRLLNALSLPRHLFPKIVPSGSRLGRLRPDLRRQSGLEEAEIVASCSHDTGAAVAAVPASGKDWAYLSSGTWSLMGVELAAPIVTDSCRELNFTNEIGYGGSVRLLKNISGLWLLQECRREWARSGQEYPYATLAEMAAHAPPFVSLINPADPRFLSPDEMPARIRAFCRETGQPEPSSPGGMVRCILESLALLYRRTLLQIEQLTGRKIQRLHVVGGGSRNALLNQFTADALELPVLAGPSEATAMGNLLVQALALKLLPSLEDARRLVRNSAEVQTIEPRAGKGWCEADERFLGWLK